MTTSGAIPAIPKPFALVRKKFPSTLSGVVDTLKKKKKKLVKKLFSKKTFQ